MSLKKLFTNEDPYFFHKIFGFYCLGNFFFQFYLYFTYGKMILTPLVILPHILLHLSSFIFHVLPKRPVTNDNKIVRNMAMFIWEELRLHSMAFGWRSCFVILFPKYSFLIVLLTMLTADIVTYYYGNPNVSTVRGNHDMEKKSIMKQIYSSFFSTSQLGATIICAGFFQDKISPYLVFATLPPIQTSAFGMTLLRKNIINKSIWQMVYSLELLLVYVIWYLEYKNLYIIAYSIISYMCRKFKIDKYILWCCFFVFSNYLDQNLALI